MMRVSKRLIADLKLGEIPAYKVAQLAGVNPATLSKLTRGIEPVRENDPRILAVARVLGIAPDEAFESEDGRK